MDPAFDPDADARDAYPCPRCGRPFARERYCTLHLGLDHSETLTRSEREAFVTEYRTETDDIRRFRLKALAVLIVVYFGFMFLFLVVT